MDLRTRGIRKITNRSDDCRIILQIEETSCYILLLEKRCNAEQRIYVLIATLVYQLVNSIPEMRDHVERRIERDPTILDLSLEAQVEALIQPLDRVLREKARREGDEESMYPRLVILDGLDECGDGKTQKYILEVLSRAVVRMSFPLIFLIASRPEPAIRNSFNKVSMSSITTRLPLDNTYEPDADIKVVIESKCEEIRETHPARASLPSPWP